MDNGSKLTAEQRALIVETAKREREIAAIPNPPKWKTWEWRDLDELREFGPRYKPAEWFGNGFPLPEKYRVKFLRALHELGHMGLIGRFTGDGGRVENVKLTATGLKMAAELMKAAKPRPKVKPKKPKPQPDMSERADDAIAEAEAMLKEQGS